MVYTEIKERNVKNELDKMNKEQLEIQELKKRIEEMENANRKRNHPFLKAFLLGVGAALIGNLLGRDYSN